MSGWVLDRNLFCVRVGSVEEDDRVRYWLEECRRRMVRDGTLGRAFYNHPPEGPEAFRNLVRGLGGAFFMIFTGDGRPESLAGIFWLTPAGPGACFAHHCFFREAYGSALSLAGVILDRLLEGFDLVRGATPETNRLGLAFLRRLGFQVAGTVPLGAWSVDTGRRVGLVESWITKDSKNTNPSEKERSTPWAATAF